MACQAIHNWTFSGLVGAFLDLAIAYLLLCASAVAFFASKFLSLFGLYLPCPCNGLFSNPNRNYCAQQLLLDCPIGQTSSAQSSAKNKFPFASIFAKDQKSDSSIKLIGDRGDYDLKGKEVITRTTCGKEEEENVSVSLDANQCYYERERTFLSEPQVETEADKSKSDEESTNIAVLRKKLEEERSAQAALYLELEEERNAAASAADEAMAMILRLQEEKAIVEMEARQYQRMIEEKAAYDLEEMNILKEIILRREMEKHVLEMEVESYRQQMNYEDKEEIEGDFQDPQEDPINMMVHQLISDFNDKNPIGRGWDEYENESKQGNLEKECSKRFSDDCSQELDEKEMMIAEPYSREDGKKGPNNQSVVSDEDVDEMVRVHDIHVIEVNRDSPSKSTLETETTTTTTGLPPIGPRGVPVNSTSALDTERLKIESEVGWLRERLRVVQQGRDKLNLNVEYREREKLQLQLIEDLLLQLQEIRHWTNEPQKAVRQVSLPLPSTKIVSKKKRSEVYHMELVAALEVPCRRLYIAF